MYKGYRKQRRKAQFGESIIAAGIQAGATTAAAAANAIAQANAARVNAEATKSAAQKQYNGLLKQNDVANANMEKQLIFTKNENAQTRSLMQGMQLNGQMQQGLLNDAERLAGGRIQVRTGGKKKRGAFLLQGNKPFSITDGGFSIPIGYTSDGYPVHQLVGDTHEQSHKVGSTRKTGIGIKFPDGQVIEGEGNELIVDKPNEEVFISKHNMNGFNPKQALLNGMSSNEVEYLQNLNRPKMKRVGRKKAAYGYRNYTPTIPNMPNFWRNGNEQQNYITDLYNSAGIKTNPTNTIGTSTSSSNNKSFSFTNSPYGGAVINGIGTGLGMLANGIGTWIGNNAVRKANNYAAGLMADAYDRLKTIDTNALNRRDFQTSRAIATVRAPQVNTSVERTSIQRNRDRQLSTIGRNSLSGAALINRTNRAYSTGNDALAQIESRANQQREQINQANAQAITQTSLANAQLDNQAAQQYIQGKLNLLQYNNDIANQRILGKANVLAGAATTNANQRAAGWQAFGQTVGNGLSSIGQSFANVAQNERDFQQKTQLAMANMSKGNAYLYAIRSNNPTAAKAAMSYYKEGDPEYEQLKRLANQAKYGGSYRTKVSKFIKGF